MNKKLYKSNTNKMICGVCGGLGEFFSIDPHHYSPDLGDSGPGRWYGHRCLSSSSRHYPKFRNRCLSLAN